MTPSDFDEYEARAFAYRLKRLRQLGYRAEITPLGDGQFYWHAWLGDTRVNGGLSESWLAASEDSTRAILQHSYQDDP